MSRETRVMWFGSIFGGVVLLLFSALGLNQFYKSLDIKEEPEKESRR
ncbi:hypothetical protein [Pseudalkalibacillus decolorationis]|nr:hypothetical protein [Pseudalkalibacillus decolorationis]